MATRNGIVAVCACALSGALALVPVAGWPHARPALLVVVIFVVLLGLSWRSRGARAPRHLPVVAELLDEAVSLVDRDLRVSYESKVAGRLLGHAPGAAHPTVLDSLHEEDERRFAAALRAALAQPDTTHTLTVRVRHASGATKVLEGRLRGVPAPQGAREVAVAWSDVAATRCSDVIDRAHEAVVTTDLAGVVTTWSKGAERLSGYSAAEAVGRNIEFLEHDTSGWLGHDQVVARVSSEGRCETQALVRRKTGEPRDVQTRFSLLRDAVGRPSGVLALAIDVTDRKRAEAALLESEERFRRLSDATTEGVAIHADGVVLDANESLSRLSGFPREEIVGRHVLDFVSPVSRALVAGRLRKPVDTPVEACLLKRDGGSFWGELRGRDVRYDGRAVRVVTVRDVTERRRTEAELLRLSRAVEQAADTVLITDIEGRIEYVNGAFERLSGYRREEAIGQTARLVKSGFQERAFYTRLWQTILSRRVFRDEFVNRKKTGEIYYERKTISPVLDARGAITHFVATGSDVTERLRAEAREGARTAVTRILADCADLRAAAPALLRAICHGMGWDVGELWVPDAERRKLTWVDGWHVPSVDAEAFEAASRNVTFGRGEGLPGRVWATGEACWILDAAADPLFVRRAFAGRHGLHGALAFPVEDGADINGVMAFLSVQARRPDDGLVAAMADVGRQVGQFIARKRSEAEQVRLRRAVERSALEWRLTFDAIDTPILVVDMTGRVVRLNRAAQALAGRGYDELIGCPVEDVSAGAPWGDAAALVRAVAVQREPRAAHLRDAGRGHTWELAANWLPAGADQDERVIVVARDVTRLMELQESLRRSETMSAMGALVAGVAHEVRNPLFAISANLDVFEAVFGDRPEYRDILTVLRGEVDRMSGLMHELLEYGRPTSQEMAPCALDDVVAEALHACARRAAGLCVELRKDVPQALPPMRMDRRRLVLVFQNLIDNGIQHSPPRGVVQVRARAVSERPPVALEVFVEDSGPGIRPEDLSRIFEPFFSRRHGGTGLGLSITARIVEQHGGEIRAGNRPEGGASIRVVLPALPDLTQERP